MADEEKTESGSVQEEAVPETVKEKQEEEKEEAAEEQSAEKTEQAKEKPTPAGKHADLVKEIEKMSVADLAELVKALEERFGVSAAPVVAAAPAAASPAAGQDEPAAAGKASYTVHLASSGDQKIAVIKALREVNPALGLKEAKDLVDGAPKDVAQNVPAEEAKIAKEKLEAAGAKVELK